MHTCCTAFSFFIFTSNYFQCLIFKNKHREKNKKFIWEFPNYYSEKDDKLWQEYLENHPEHFTEEPKLKKDDAWDHLDEIRKK